MGSIGNLLFDPLQLINEELNQGQFMKPIVVFYHNGELAMVNNDKQWV